MAPNKYTRFVAKASRGVAYWTKVAMRDFTEDLLVLMKARNDMTNAALAERAGVSPAYITKVLRGTENFTLETMTKLALAVGGSLRIHVADRSTQTQWLDLPKTITPIVTSRPAQRVSVFEWVDIHPDRAIAAANSVNATMEKGKQQLEARTG